MNQRGFAEVAVLYGIIAIMALLFIPNPVGKVLGVGVQPNKIVQKESHKEEIVPVITIDGQQCGFKKVSTDSLNDDSIQQHITFWQWLGSLPIIVLLLMGAGVIFPGLALSLHRARISIESHAKKIVNSVDAGLATLKDPVVKQTFLDEMTKVQGKNSKTEAIVTDLQQK